MPHPIPAAPSLRTASVLPRRRARGARRPRPPASPVCGPLAARVAGGGAGDAGGGGGAPIHAHSSDCPAAWPWDPAGPLRLPWGNNCGWKGRRVTLRLELRPEAPKRKPRPGDREHRGPQARGPRARGTRPRPATPHCAPIAALADLNWPRESSPQDPPPSHPRAQTETCTLTHTHTYLHSRSCSPAHTTTHISTHAHGHKLALTHVLTCTLTDTHLHTQT